MHSACMTVLPPRMMLVVPMIWDLRETLLPVSCCRERGDVSLSCAVGSVVERSGWREYVRCDGEEKVDVMGSSERTVSIYSPFTGFLDMFATLFVM